MDGRDFLRIIGEVFVPSLAPLNFMLSESRVSGKEYGARFSSSTHSVTVSYEPPDDYLTVRISNAVSPTLAQTDDPNCTVTLEALRARYRHLVELAERKSVQHLIPNRAARGSPEYRLSTAALDLRLLIPRHLEKPPLSG
jgi:hypothetical protein